MKISAEPIAQSEFRIHVRKYLRQVRKAGGPLMISRRGEPSIVLVSAELFATLYNGKKPRKKTVRRKPKPKSA